MTNSRSIPRQPGEIVGKVALIINERELVINIGHERGVSRGMRFAILANEPQLILDPDTSEEIGRLEPEKVRVEATDVRKQMTICRTYEYDWVGSLDLSNLQAALGFQPRRKVNRTLRASDSDYPEPLPESESLVKIGDRVRLLPPDPEMEEAYS